MSQSLIITDLLTVPGLSRASQETGTILVGLVVDDSEIAWGSCEDIPVLEPPAFQPPFQVDEGMATIKKTVSPVMIGMKVNDFRSLASEIEALREIIVINKPITQTEKPSQGLSRRAIITGFLSSESKTETTIIEKTTVERPIHPVIRSGLSQALLGILSRAQGLTEVEIITKAFDLPNPSTAVALQMPIQSGQSLVLHEQISALAYTVEGVDPASVLGTKGERIQRFIRQLRERLVGTDQPCQLAIHLNAKGYFGKLYNNDIGKILGALYGLEQAASPCLLRIQDPFILDDLEGQIKALKQLRDYIRMRGMSLRLVAGAKINTLEDVQSFVKAGAAHMLHLVIPQLGTVQEVVLAVQACRNARVGILLEGTCSAFSAQVALATQPDLLTFPDDRPGDHGIAILHNEMTRASTWLTKKENKVNR